MWRHPLAALAIALFSASTARPGFAQSVLPPAVIQALDAAGVPADSLAAAALPLGHDAPVWEYRADVAMQPGSTMKVLTSIVALDFLSPDHRGRTELLTAAPLTRGVLRGDLVLGGGADPDLGVPQLWALLVDLRQQGVREIRGDLLLDRTRFRPARTDQGVPPFDNAPEFAYNVIPDALELAGNLLPLRLSSDPRGVHAVTVPPLAGLRITSRMGLSNLPCDDWDHDWQPATVSHRSGHPRIELQGVFPRGCSVRTALQLIDRDELAALLFRSLWQGLGGRWTGRARAAPAPAGARVLALHVARPWGEVLRSMNKRSDNPLARLLFLELGVPSMAGDPVTTTAELAAREVRRWLAEHGIADRGLVIDNGSGLSRQARITPRQLASTLASAYFGPHAPDLLMSLPVAGVDGTLRDRLRDSPAAGWARLKTGSLRDTVALAGYLRDGQGRPWAVAMMVNHDGAERARPALDALVDSLSRAGVPALAAGDDSPAPAAPPIAPAIAGSAASAAARADAVLNPGRR
jgi:serine-type D-Ala-D-Ala carboxypeptidase/endopeptidase (penicillin-binding protein 4)